MRIDYRYKINDRRVTLVVDKDLSNRYSSETNQMFLRPLVSGNMKLLGEDFDYLNDQPVTTEFILTIESSIDGASYSDYWSGIFYKTDCEWNEDDKIVKIKVDTNDAYTKIIDGYDNEYDIIKLNPQRTIVKLHKRPMIQVYVPGDEVITSFVGGTYFEQTVTEAVTDERLLTNKYYFSVGSYLNKVFIDTRFSPNIDDFDAVLRGSISGKYIAYFVGSDYDVQYVTTNRGRTYKYILYRRSDSAVLFESSTISSRSSKPKDSTIYMAAVHVDVSGYVLASWQELKVYMRYVLDTESILGKTTYRLPLEDIVSDSRNYKYCIGYAFNLAVISTKLTSEPTKYGLATPSLYFDSPYSVYNTKYLPISRSNWGLSSLWFNFYSFNTYIEEQGRKEYYLYDVFKISSVISKLIKEIDPSLVHSNSVDYSEFLYSQYDPVAGKDIEIMIAPKSNILAGEYDKAAMKAPVSLSTILDMLRNVFKCYYFIDGNKFRIEHISYFKKGGSYTDLQLTNTDLTTLKDRKNKKPYGLYSKKFKFDKPAMVSRYEFSWMDDVTPAFEGSPIDVNSGFVKKNKNETVTAGQFNSDIDYMLLNPEDNSRDGFALISAQYNIGESVHEIPITRVSYDGASLLLQNGDLCWPEIHKNWWIYDMPSYDLTVNESSMLAQTVSKLKKQNVSYPSILDPNPLKLIVTPMGYGKIEKMEINLASRYNKIELSYDTE